MNRIEQAFQAGTANGGRLFLPYLCAGDPDLEQTRELIYTAADNGADLLELGLPFSDPVADGPTIQAAVRRSLQNGYKMDKIFALVADLRTDLSLPIVAMTYYNPILRRGEEKFVRQAVEAGIDGVLVVDLPPEEGQDFYEYAAVNGLETVLLATPTTPPERVRELSQLATGFLYYVMVTGVTGARTEYDPRLEKRLRQVKENSELPVAAGFGVSNYQMIEPYLEYVHGVVVGSAIIDRIEKHLDDPPAMNEAVGRFIADLAEPLHAYEGKEYD